MSGPSMRINRARRPWTAAIGRGLAVAAALTALGSAAAPKFYDDDPITADRDTQDASRIRRWKIDLCVDVPLNLFSTLGDPASGVRAKNVNTIDEVPHSSWFTNRLGSRPATPDAAPNGPEPRT